MRNNSYESSVLINAALDDEQIEAVITRIQDYIVNLGAEIIEVEKWGRKRLAYLVNKSKIGYYAIYRFSSPSNIITKLERSYVLDENILRFLTIELDQAALEYFEKNKTVPPDLALEPIEELVIDPILEEEPDEEPKDIIL